MHPMPHSRWAVQLWPTACLLIAALCSAGSSRLSAADTYSNPVLPGDFPDPSVIRVGQEYWATATSSEWGPLFPLLRSTDLVHWELAGHVFHSLPEWAVANFWAPEISEYRGKFYIYYVGRKRGGPLSISVATAAQPQGPWRDHGPLIGQPAGSIDADTAVDEQGERYLIWKEDGNSRRQPTPIWAQKLSEDGTKLVGEMKELLRNDAPWEKQLVEGPFVLRRNGYFYMFYSGNGCCGAGCNYALGVARAKQLLGPWEKNPANPILAGNTNWRCPGHGSIITTPDGHDLLLYHAYDAKAFIYVGRQGLLDEVNWGPDGWPTINNGQGPGTHGSAPLPLTVPAKPGAFFDAFTASILKPDWQWPVNNEPLVTLKPGALQLKPRAERARDIMGGVLAVQTRAADYRATTQLSLGQLPAGFSAGLSAFGDGANALGLSVTDRRLTLWRRQKNQHTPLAMTEAPGDKRLQLRMDATGGHRFRFSASSDGKTWQMVGPEVDLEGEFLPPWDRGVRVALVAGGKESSDDASATFEWLRVEP
jgi:beta-xylosidase